MNKWIHQEMNKWTIYYLLDICLFVNVSWLSIGWLVHLSRCLCLRVHLFSYSFAHAFTYSCLHLNVIFMKHINMYKQKNKWMHSWTKKLENKRTNGHFTTWKNECMNIWSKDHTNRKWKDNNWKHGQMNKCIYKTITY